MAERLPERLSQGARLVVLTAGWVAIYISLLHRMWAVVCLVGIVAILWILWLERRTTPRQSIPEVILRTVLWAMASFLAFLVFVVFFLFFATVGWKIGLWGSPWDGR